MKEGKGIFSWALLVGTLAFFGLVMAIIFGNLSGNLGFTDAQDSLTVTNESNAWLNGTDYTVAIVNSTTSTYSITAIWGAQGGEYNISILTTNASISAVGVVSNLTAVAYDNVSISYTLINSYDTQAELDAESVISNYTESVTNTSAQFPVVGTIIGVALLLLVLIGILIYAMSKMGGLSASGQKKSYSEGGFA